MRAVAPVVVTRSATLVAGGAKGARGGGPTAWGQGARFGLLGPLLVHDGHRAISLRSGKRRTLIAVLLLRAGAIVPADELADRIWDGSPPGESLNALHVLTAQHS